MKLRVPTTKSAARRHAAVRGVGPIVIQPKSYQPRVGVVNFVKSWWRVNNPWRTSDRIDDPPHPSCARNPDDTPGDKR